MNTTNTSFIVKNQSFLLVLLNLFVFLGSINAQDREVVVSAGGAFGAGVSTNLRGWTQQHFEAVTSRPFAGAFASSLTDLEGINSTHLSDGNMSDVLFIGYDLGGLAARGMIERDAGAASRIGALVLVGVPNQGSVLTDQFFSEIPGALPPVKQTIDILGGLTSTANDCRTCDQVSLLQDLYDNVNDPAASGFQAQARPGSPYLNSLPAAAPVGVPTVVMYGDIGSEAYPLSRILGSTALQSAPGTNFVSCVQDELQDRRDEINATYADAVIENTIGFASLAFNFIKGVLNPGELGEFVEGVESAAQNLRMQISAAKRRDRQLGELLECEYVFQSMNAEWNLWSSRSFDETVTVVVDEVCCEDECDSYLDHGQPTLDWERCIDGCYALPPNERCQTITHSITTYISSDDTDGVYAHSEMDLDGAIQTFVMLDTDHRQEIAVPDHEAAREEFRDLYNGAAGPEFMLTPR